MEFVDDIWFFEDKDAKLINQSSHFGGKMGWKSDEQLDKMFTNLALKAN
tara:strand:+ start:396 stop:542 length:147 start_codon:yes stop_codon:yes gene_type:complete